MERDRFIGSAFRIPTLEQRREAVGHLEDKSPIKDVEDPSADVERGALVRETLSELYHVLSRLTPRQREAIELRYGFHDGEARSFDKVGEVMGISGWGAGQLERRALQFLRNHLLHKRPDQH
jgi:RNA polymerase sigma factor (sigma-70 family)